MHIRRYHLFLIFSAVVMGIGIYCFNPFELYFQNDDFIHLLLSKNGELFQRQFFRPVCDISMIIDQRIWETNAHGYHVTNLILHIICSLLVFVVIKKVLEKLSAARENRVVISWFTALLFFVYGFHSEAVFWILGRSAILGAIFSLLFLYFFLKRNTSFKAIAGYCVFYAIALLTYESTWVLPLFAFMILVLDRGTTPARRIHPFFHAGIILILFLIYLWIRLKASGELMGEYSSVNFLQLNGLILFVHFLKLSLRGFSPYMHVPILLIAMFLFAGMLLAFFVFQLGKKAKLSIAVLALFFLISLLPYLSMGIDFHGTEGERFLYFPSVIVCFMMVYILAQYKHRAISYLAYIFVIACHCAMLIISAGNNRLAGDINQLVFSEISQLNGEDLYVQGLPSTQYGAVILRNGFMEGLRFLNLENKVNTVTICSQRNGRRPLSRPYTVITSAIAGENILCGEKPVSNQATPISKVAFIFTDTALLIKK